MLPRKIDIRVKENQRLSSTISLAQKAGRIRSGEFAVEKAIPSGEAQLVIVASDASDNTKKKFRDSCTYYHVPFVEYETKANLGHAIGRQMRAVICVTDQGFAKKMLEMMDRKDTEVEIDGENEN